ncbi:SipW-dependent-type signal peptide-containing protein [Nocardioides antri]|nr:SipW-dependent-type signal peptide-containing protein [Nocardioides antri]
MGRHVASSGAGSASGWFGGRWFGRGRTRALLCVGVLAALGAVGTSASWTDTASLTTGPLTGGAMDLQLQTATAGVGAVGLGTNHTEAEIAAPNLTPSESKAFAFTVRNVGNADFTYGATVTQTGTWTFTAGAITVQLFSGGAPSTDTTYPVQEACAGGTPITTAVAVTSTNTVVIPTTRALVKNTNDSLCLVVAMATSADNTNQGKQGTLKLDFTANQVTS